MDIEVSHDDVPLATGTLLRPCSAYRNMLIEFANRYVLLTELTILWTARTSSLMLRDLFGLECPPAMLAILLGMEFLVVLLQIVYVDHLLTNLALLDISTAVTEVAVDLRFWEHLAAVLALLFWLHGYGIKYFQRTSLRYQMSLPFVSTGCNGWVARYAVRSTLEVISICGEPMFVISILTVSQLQNRRVPVNWDVVWHHQSASHQIRVVRCQRF